MSAKIKIGDISFDISNEDKIFFPKSNITKGDLIEYYKKIAPYMFPHIEDRIITMHRFPNGIKEEGFYQKDAPDYFPSWIKTKKIAKKNDGSVNYVVIDNKATPAYLANQGCITVHAMLCKADKIKHPDKMIFDLDPLGKTDYDDVIWSVREIKKVLDDLDVTAFVMTTGSRGVHVIAPLKQDMTFDNVKKFAQKVARYLVKQYPDKLTLEMSKSKRGNKIFIDTLRNAFGATGVAPYSVRALEGAPIATPLEWDELLQKQYGPQKFTIKNIFKRLAQKDDPWKHFFKSAQSLKHAQKKLDGLIEKE